MNRQNTEEIDKQVVYWRKKLNTYLNEDTDDKYNEEDVQAIRDLLKIFEQADGDDEYYTAEKSLERFWQTAETRAEIQDEMRQLMAGEISLADYADEDESKVGKTQDVGGNEQIRKKSAAILENTKKYLTFRTRSFHKIVMVASLVIMLLIGGTVGAYAQKEGVFSKIVNSEEKSVVAANPSTNTNLDEYRIIKDIEKLPMKYLNYVWTPTDIPDNIELCSVEIMENNFSVNVVCKYLDQETKQFVDATKKTFRDKVSVADQMYDGFDLYRNEQYESVEVQYLIKANKDYTEYVALFEYGNSAYTLSSNCDFAIIEDIIIENISNDNL